MRKAIETLLNHDVEPRQLLRFLARASVSTRARPRVLDVGCGYGRNLKLLRDAGYEVLGVDVNPITVEANRKAGLACVSAAEFPSLNEGRFDVVLMSHIIEHFAPEALLGFIDGYLDRLNAGGHLIVVTPLMSPYFYDDFDHVKPYQPAGLMMVFGASAAQVQFSSRNKLALVDIWFRRSYCRATFARGRYLGGFFGKLVKLFEIVSAGLFFASGYRLGRKDAWMGIFRKINA